MNQPESAGPPPAPNLEQTTPSSASPDEPKTSKAAKNMSLGRKTGRALFWNVFFLPLKAGLQLFVTLVIVKTFPLEAYAVLAAVTAVLSTLGLYVDLGIERALPRFVSEIEQKQGRAALRLFITRITLIKLAVLTVVVLIITVAAEPIISWMGSWGDQGHIYLALISMLLVLGALYDICTQILYSFFKQKVTNLLDIVVTVLNPLLTLLLVGPLGLRVYGVVLALLITTVISVGIAGWQAWLASKDLEVKLKTPKPNPAPSATDTGVIPRESLLKRFIRYAALMYFFNISAWFYDASFAMLVFTFYREIVTVALIRLIYNFIKTLLKNLLSPFVGVQTPLFSSIHAEGHTPKLHTAYASISKLQIFILVPSSIGAIILARNILELLFARKSADAVLPVTLLEPATWATILTIIFTFAEALISLPMVILMVYERYRAVILARTLPLLAGPLLILTAALHWNVVVAVTIMGLMAVSSRVMAMVSLQRTLGLYYPVKFLLKVSKAALAFGIPLQILVLFLPINWPITLGIAGTGVIIFYAVFKGLGGFDLEDKNRLQTLKMPLRKYIIKWF
ncbi:MAG: oligosaccharide flippase family protein [Chloroflexota bacterium]|nr:lipopolysaccharide biosynthesis protein [Chloroflexota bacterium]